MFYATSRLLRTAFALSVLCFVSTPVSVANESIQDPGEEVRVRRLRESQATIGIEKLSQLPTVIKSGAALLESTTSIVAPDYPPAASAARVGGSVSVEVTVNEEGSVVDAVGMGGRSLLRDAAVKAARRWRFRPVVESGRPVRFRGIFTFHFVVKEQPGRVDPATEVGITADVIHKSEEELLQAAVSKHELTSSEKTSWAVIRILIDEQGEVLFARSLNTIPISTEGARDAAMQWKFSPTLINGMPTRVYGIMTIAYKTPSFWQPVSLGVDRGPIALNNPPPSYTEAARQNRTEGVVRLVTLIGADGEVKEVRIISGLPHGLSEEAIKTVKAMKFKPALRDGMPVELRVALEITFKLP